MTVRALMTLLSTLVAVAQDAHALDLRQGDLLISDLVGDKILHVDPDTGTVQDFSPRDGGTNLLAGPAGIAIDPDGTIFVASSATSKLIAIDPLTGEQSEVVGTQGPLDIGTETFGLDISDHKSSPQDRRDLYVASEGVIYRVGRSASLVAAAPLVADPLLELQRDLAIAEVAGNLDAIYIATAAGIVRYQPSTPSVEVLYAPQQIFVLDIDWVESLVLTQIRFCGDEDDSGVFAFAGAATPIATGSFVLCPEALAGSRLSGHLELFVTDNGADGLPPTLAKVAEVSAGTFEQSFIATLPEGTEPIAVAVSPITFTPEPGATALAIVAMASIALRARR